MGLIISKIIDNECKCCGGTGKYPSYKYCDDCYGTGQIYTIQGTISNILIKTKLVES